MREIKVSDVSILFPESYAEVSFRDQVELAALSSGLLGFSGIEATVLWREIMMVLLRSGWQLPPKGFRIWWRELELDICQFEAVKALASWVNEKPQQKPFEHFDFKGERYYVLNERLEHMSAGEWVECIQDFISMPYDESFLDMLLANFCRPRRVDLEEFRQSEKWNGDIKEVYNRQRAIERTKIFAELEVGIKIQLLWWWESQLQLMFDENKDLFAPGGERSRYPDGRGYVMLLKNVAKQGYLGNLEKVYESDVMSVFALLTDEVLDAKELQAKYK